MKVSTQKLALGLFSTGLSFTTTANNPKPNIILFLVDDMGWQDSSEPFWNIKTYLNKDYHTPNMERLADQGVKFTQAYACAVSSPTRVSLMTGQNAALHRVTNWTLNKNKMPVKAPKGFKVPMWNVNGIGISKNLENSVYTPQPLPKVLQQNGYKTIHCGKAHFGAFKTPTSNPKAIGFDINIAGHACGGLSNYYAIDNFSRKKPSRWDVPGLEEFHGKDIHLNEALTRKAIEALETSLEENNPFFLYMAHYAVHSPIQEDKRFYQKYLDKGMHPIEAKYASMLESMDKSLGDLMDFVEEKKIADNTIILFMSDNGGLSALGRGGFAHRHNWPLTSGKGSINEGGIRVPMIVKWPNHTKKNTVCKDYLIIEDFYPTIIEMAGISQLSGECQQITGKSFVQLLEGKEQINQDRPLYWHYPNNWGPSGPGIDMYSCIRLGDWKLIYYYKDNSFQLFNIENDIEERYNLAQQKPELTRKLAKKLTNYLKSVNAQRPTRIATNKLCKYPDECIEVIKERN